MSNFTQPCLTDACEQIDAAMFSGDSFSDPVNREALREYIGRWERQMKVNETVDVDEGSYMDTKPEDLYEDPDRGFRGPVGEGCDLQPGG